MARKRTPKWLQSARAGDVRREPGERPDWLGRALARAGGVPDGDSHRYVHSKRVTVNGAVVVDPLAPIREGDEVRVDGEVVSLAARTRVLAFHKPAGLVTAAADPEGGGTVFEAMRERLSPELLRFGWHAVGRLDRATTGLLLFTNDERFVEHATSPDTHLPKRYVARVDGRIDEAKLARLRDGIELEGATTLPAEASSPEPGVVVLTISEGRHHQVRRMLDAVGLPVRALHRDAIGALVLDVNAGAVRELSDDEIREALRFEPRRVHAAATGAEH